MRKWLPREPAPHVEGGWGGHPVGSAAPCLDPRAGSPSRATAAGGEPPVGEPFPQLGLGRVLQGCLVRRAHSLSLGSCFSFRASSPSPRGQGGLTPASCHLLPPWRKPPSLENPGCAETGGTRSDLPMSIQALCLFFNLVVWGHLVVELQELFYIVWISTSY